MKIELGGILLVLFITLKLCGVIHWAWLWVLSPLWMPVVAVCAFMVSVMAVIVAKEVLG